VYTVIEQFVFVVKVLIERRAIDFCAGCNILNRDFLFLLFNMQLPYYSPFDS